MLKVLRQPSQKMLTLYFLKVIATYTVLDHNMKTFSKLHDYLQRKMGNKSHNLTYSSSVLQSSFITKHENLSYYEAFKNTFDWTFKRFRILCD